MNRFPKLRIDNLADSVFAFAMTLLVLDVRLPSGLPIGSAADLTAHLLSLWRQLVIYLISFFVLGALWRASIARRPAGEHLSGIVTFFWLAYLFFVTMVPFSCSVVGKYGEFEPAVIVYSINMIALGVLVICLRYLEVPADKRSFAEASGAYLPVFIASAFLAMLASLFEPRYAMFVYFLNLLVRLPGWLVPSIARKMG